MNLQENIHRIQTMMGVISESAPETKTKLKIGLEEIEGEEEKLEQNESELTEKCWKGYTQKGMKTMFGKRYPNCVKKTK